jgi:hypothetical protein
MLEGHAWRCRGMRDVGGACVMFRVRGSSCWEGEPCLWDDPASAGRVRSFGFWIFRNNITHVSSAVWHVSSSTRYRGKHTCMISSMSFLCLPPYY